MLSKIHVWRLIAGSLLCLPALCENPATTQPADPLEIATGAIRPVRNLAARKAVLSFLGRARDRYALRSAGSAYDLKVSFKVDSGGQTAFDGAWQMEDVFDPKLGLRWTAKASASYSITRISSNGTIWEDATGSYVPLRLEEARAALLDPMPSAANAAGQTLRTVKAVLNGVKLECILFSGSGGTSSPGAGRRWQESEECIDPVSGLLRVQSQIPGRYYFYDYSRPLQLGGRILPDKVTVAEGGNTVSEISVDSLTELPAADPALFVPTEDMKARGPAAVLGGAQKRALDIDQAASAQGAVPDVVCVFGVVTAAGQLEEAHSLEPSDPNSQPAIAAIQEKYFSLAPLPGAHPRQHFVFIVAKFLASK